MFAQGLSLPRAASSSYAQRWRPRPCPRPCSLSHGLPCLLVVLFMVVSGGVFVLLPGVVLVLGMVLACREVTFFLGLGGLLLWRRTPHRSSSHSKAIIPSAINIGVFLVVPINVNLYVVDQQSQIKVQVGYTPRPPPWLPRKQTRTTTAMTVTRTRTPKTTMMTQSLSLSRQSKTTQPLRGQTKTARRRLVPCLACLERTDPSCTTRRDFRDCLASTSSTASSSACGYPLSPTSSSYRSSALLTSSG